MHSVVLNKRTYPTNDVISSAESAFYIMHIFANNFTNLKLGTRKRCWVFTEIESLMGQ